VLSLVMVSVGCGSDDSQTPTRTPTPIPTATTAPTATPMATPSPTPTPDVTATPAMTATPATSPTPVPTLSTDPPCRFRGTVKLDGADVPDGTAITVFIKGDPYTTNTPSVYGSSTYVIQIPQRADSPYKEGEAISFTIDQYPAQQTGTWEWGGNTELNLTASTT